ncbi:hypothetical protein BDV18DRAFT_135072, partial [Aspergillus unguis]
MAQCPRPQPATTAAMIGIWLLLDVELGDWTIPGQDRERNSNHGWTEDFAPLLVGIEDSPASLSGRRTDYSLLDILL